MGRFRSHHHREPNGGMNAKVDTYTTVQKFGVSKIFEKSLMLTKAAFIYLHLFEKINK